MLNERTAHFRTLSPCAAILTLCSSGVPSLTATSVLPSQSRRLPGVRGGARAGAGVRAGDYRGPCKRRRARRCGRAQRSPKIARFTSLPPQGAGQELRISQSFCRCEKPALKNAIPRAFCRERALSFHGCGSIEKQSDIDPSSPYRLGTFSAAVNAYIFAAISYKADTG